MKVKPSSNVESPTKSDHLCIKQLSEAEKRAKQVVEEARKRRMVLMKKARDESTRELDSFKKNCETRLDKIVRENSSSQSSDAANFDKEMESKRSELNRMFNERFDLTFDFVIGIFDDIKAQSHENFIKQ